MTRTTTDGYDVQDHTIIYEPIIRYINPEYSSHEPMMHEAIQVPEAGTMFRILVNCERYCQIINELKNEIR